MCAHNQLFLPTVATARDMIRRGELGKVYAARTTDVFALDVTAETLGWRATRATSGGGGVIGTGDHPKYLLPALLGRGPGRGAAPPPPPRPGVLGGGGPG